ncbi:MAG: lipopolysaccharide biosynthesis protein [Deltaproteobacteria bacterium]|nr:lipopolysaccharide biosynthesis protein [Deltaproteobacteria bacterium]
MSQSPSPTSATASKHGASDARYAFRGGLVQLLGILGQAFMTLQGVIVPRLFGPTAYGLYSGLRDLVEILARAACLGTDKGLYRFVAGHCAAGEPERAADATAVALRITAVTGVVLAGVAAVAAPFIAKVFHRPEVAGLLPFIAPAIFGLSMTFTAVAASLGYKRPKAQLHVRGIAEPLLLVGATAVAGVVLPRITTLAVIHGAVYFVIAWFAVSRLPRDVYASLWSRLRHARYPGLLAFSLPVAALELTNIVRHRVDGMVVFAMFPPKTAALYFASETIGRIAANIRYAFDGIVAPMFSEAIHTHDRLRLQNSYRVLTRMVATLSFPLAMSLISLRERLVLLSGDAFASAAMLVPFHVSGHLANGVLGLAGHVLMMAGRTRWLLINQLIAAGVNILACVLLIPRFGLLGAAYAFLLGWAVSLGTTLVEVAIVERVQPFGAGLFKPGAAAVLMYLAQRQAQHIDNVFINVGVTLLGGLAVYATSLVALGLDPTEKAAVAKQWQRLRRRSE